MLSMAIEGGKTAGWPIPPEVKEDFTTFCKDVGSLAKDDCAGALFVWQYLPAQIREWAKLGAKGVEPVGKRFWTHFGAGMEAYIERGFLDFLTGRDSEAEQPHNLIERLRAVVSGMSDSEYHILSREEQAIVDDVRRELEPTPDERAGQVLDGAVADAKEIRGKVHRRTGTH